MTNMRPERRGLGLDIPGPDEPSFLPGAAGARPSRSWLAGRNLVGSLIRSLFFTGYAVWGLVHAITNAHGAGTFWLMFVFAALMALWSLSSVIYFALRRRRRRGAASPAWPSR